MRLVAGTALILLVGLGVLAACGDDTGSDPVIDDGPDTGSVNPPATDDEPQAEDESDDGAGGEPDAPPPLGVVAVLGSFDGLDLLDGGTFESTTVHDGHPAVVWFWAPWCPTCRAVAPTVADLVDEHGEQLTFLGVAGRGGRDEMHEFTDSTGTGTMAHVVDGDGSVWSEFGVTTQPAFALVDPDGTVDLVIRPPHGDLADRVAALAG